MQAKLIGSRRGKRRQALTYDPVVSRNPRFDPEKQKRGGRRAVEKAGPWKERKNKGRFPLFPPPLESRKGQEQVTAHLKNPGTSSPASDVVLKE
jgi:hypothetical protein